MRYPFWVSNSTEAENCTKKQTNEQINLLLENSKFLQLQSCKIYVSKLCIKSKNTIMVIINDVFSLNSICTYQEKKSYHMHKNKTKKSFLSSMVVEISKAIQEELGKYLFSKKFNCLITAYQFTNLLIYQIKHWVYFVLCMVQVNTYLINFNKNKANLTIFVGAFPEISHL